MYVHMYGWFAYLSAAATILTFLTGILFFTIGKPFGKINDISSVFQVLFMIPLAIVLSRTVPARYFALGLIAAIIGVSGMILSAIGQSLLIFGRIDFQGSLKFFPAGGAIGIWLIFNLFTWHRYRAIASIITLDRNFSRYWIPIYSYRFSMGWTAEYAVLYWRNYPRNKLSHLGNLAGKITFYRYFRNRHWFII